MPEQPIRWQHPLYGDVRFVLSEEENDTVHSAIEHLDTDFALFINMAFTWGTTAPADYGKEEFAELTKENVVGFAEYVDEQQPKAEWMAGNGELEMWGDLDPESGQA